MVLTAFDKNLLNILQTELPLHPRPFSVLAERFGVEETVVLQRLRCLKEQGLIRRIGPFFDSAKLGYEGVLVAVDVEEQHLIDVAQAINAYPGVTHNYEREGSYNLWFTLLTPDMEVQERILGEIRRLDGVNRLMSLPAIKKYKVNVQFTLS
jgi:DNA-binding Lrp family transcriptional regulator